MLTKYQKENIESIHQLSGLPVFFFTDSNLIYTTDTDCPFFTDPTLQKLASYNFSDSGDLIVIEQIHEKSVAALLDRSADPILYALILFSEMNCVLGPFSLSQLNFRFLHEYARQQQLSLPKNCNISTISANKLLHTISLIQSCITGSSAHFSKSARYSILKTDIEPDPHHPDELHNYQLANSENEIFHTSSAIEEEFCECIRTADLDRLIKFSGTISEDEVGQMAHTSFKQEEYTTIVAITLMSRAAIEGGVDTQTSYEITDLHLQKLSLCKSIAEIRYVMQQSALRYIAEVAEVKQTSAKSVHIENAKNYIIRHLNAPLNINVIANEVEISPSQLMHLFQKYEDTTVMEFVSNERIKAASNMLRFSTFSVSQIANYYQYSTPSYFTSSFHKATGMTPSEYRIKYHNSGF